MNRGALRAEVMARGFDYLDDDQAGRDRADRWINEAILEDICADQPWDFLLAETSGTAPLTVTDLDTVISVKDADNDWPLQVTDIGWLENTYSDLTVTGRAEWAYATGEDTIDVFPVDTATTYQVRYWKVPAELVDDADEPVIPSRWHGLIVEGAVIRALRDKDNYDAAERAQGWFDRRLGKMAAAEMVRSAQPGLVRPVTHSWWW